LSLRTSPIDLLRDLSLSPRLSQRFRFPWISHRLRL
jgi:hypothetical protein